MAALVYMDTSALVKLYVSETGTGQVEAVANESQGRFVTSVITYPEARGVFARYLQEGKLTPEAHDEIVTAFDTDWQGMNEVDVTPVVYRRAGALVAVHLKLRAMDAIHLSSALEVQQHADVLFMTYDKNLQLVSEKILPGCVWME